MKDTTKFLIVGGSVVGGLVLLDMLSSSASSDNPGGNLFGDTVFQSLANDVKAAGVISTGVLLGGLAILIL